MIKKKVAVICEFSGVVRRAFRALGHDAYSFDLLPSDDNSPHHIQGDALDQDYSSFDLGILHPPCTDIAVSGARHFERKGRARVLAGIRFALDVWNLPFPQCAMENPISLLSRWQKPTQIIQPWMFGHGETKATCLWLRGLPKLQPTHIILPPKREDYDDYDSHQEALKKWQRVHFESPGPERWKRRSRTLEGIAAAMADQWGSFI